MKLTLGILNNWGMGKLFGGCPQGDPISPYLFIIASQILNLLIIKNAEIKGITIKDCEFKTSQFAYDTTLILKGSYESMIAGLNTLKLFGSISGLKINTNKTKVTWIGENDILKIN